MSEEIKPEVIVNPETADVAPKEQETAAVVEETVVEAPAEEAKVEPKVEEVKEEVKETVMNFADKTLAELSELFQKLSESEDRMKRSKEAEAIKSAFYKRLSREKAEAGEDATVEEPDENTPVEENTVPLQSGPVSPFAAIEAGFKSLLAGWEEVKKTFKAERK